MQKSLACLFTLFFFCANAQVPSLLKDINTALANGSPQGMTTVGNTVFFSATDSAHGTELWKSDGTVAGTVMVKDINPGSGDAFPRNFCNVNGTVFFAASDGFQGTELWKSDGTANGTVMVKDIVPGSNNSAPNFLFAVGNKVFFAAFHATKGYELWKSDGTEAGTVLLKDINPNGANSNPSNFTLLNNALFFAANSTQGRELWKLDLATELVSQVKDIHTNGDAQPENLTVFNGQLFFSATSLNNGVADRELWKSTGVIGNATLVKNINAAASSNPHQLKVFNGALFFAAQSQNNGVELFKSDGTTAGTPSIPSFDLIIGQGSSSPFNLTVANNTLFFAATSTANGRELWKVATNNAASEVKNIVAGPNGSFPQALITVGTTLFFTANNGIHGRELWKSNAQGTDMVQDIVTGAANSDISEIDLCPRGTDLFFSSKGNGTVGIELRRSNGSPNSVLLVRNIGQAGSFPREFVKMGNFTFFSADDGISGRSLWKTDGTELGTVMIGAAGINPTELTVVTDGNISTLFFVGGGFRQIFKSNGTTAGTGAVQTQLLGGVGQNPTNLTTFQGKLFFTATNIFINPNGALEEGRLFKSDGTQDGTQQVTGSPLDPRSLTVAGDKLFCSATDDLNGRELWRTTVNGVPFMVKNIRAGNAGSNPSSLIAIGSTLFFTANLGVNGVELFKSNGLVGNATVLSNFAAADPLMGEFTNFNGRLFFTTPFSGIAGHTNIQRVNTALTGIETVVTGSAISQLRAAGTTLFFFQAFHQGVIGLSKITTVNNAIAPVKEFPEGNSGIPTEAVVAGNNLFFNMSVASIGNELWKSNPATNVTTLLSDIRSGVGNSNVQALRVCGIDLFFSANNLTNGQEPWKLANATAFDDGGSDERSAVLEVMEIPTSEAPEIKVYPNPAANFVNVDLPENELTGTLSILSASGQLIRSLQSSEGETSIQMDIQDLPKGVYLVRWVQGDEQVVVKKLIVQ